MNNTGKIFAAFAIGAIAGAVAGILMAPDKGSLTRKKIADAGKKLGENLETSFKKGKEKLAGLKEELRQEIEEFA
jgi:gas vesicle protein